MTLVFFGLLVGLQVKHYIADYLLQPSWILRGKGDMTKAGGYAHAGIHAAFSLVVLLAFGTPLWLVATLCVGEFALHYCLDFAKVHYSAGVDPDQHATRYWGLHGLDQLFHQLTYAAMIFAAVRVEGLG
ncbi:MAG: DUF3307 domain-containing protein [Devosia sp.]